MRRAPVLGGAGQLGHAVADHLLDRGWRVQIVAREGRRPDASLLSKGAQAIDAGSGTRAAVLRAAEQPSKLPARPIRLRRREPGD